MQEILVCDSQTDSTKVKKSLHREMEPSEKEKPTSVTDDKGKPATLWTHPQGTEFSTNLLPVY